MTPEEFRTIRRALGLNQTQMGCMVEAGLQSVSEWERGIRPVQARAARLMRAYESGYRPDDWPAP